MEQRIHRCGKERSINGGGEALVKTILTKGKDEML